MTVQTRVWRRLAVGALATATLGVGAATIGAAPANADTLPLSTEFDACSGQLTVLSNDRGWIPITRGTTTPVNVTVNADGYWQWKCGSSLERSRGSVLPHQVNFLKVLHSTENRDITWHTFHVS